MSRAKVILQQEQKIKEEEKEVELADQEKEKAVSPFPQIIYDC